jgi:hypothetical protein
MVRVERLSLIAKVVAVMCLLILTVGARVSVALGPEGTFCALSKALDCDSEGKCEASGSESLGLPLFFVLNFGNGGPTAEGATEGNTGKDTSGQYEEARSYPPPEDGLIRWSLVLERGAGATAVLSGYCKVP